MQEEVTQKTIALVFKSSRLTVDVLKKAMKMYLERRKAGQQATHGKMSVKKLVGQPNRRRPCNPARLPRPRISKFHRYTTWYRTRQYTRIAIRTERIG